MIESLLRTLEARYGGSIPFARAATLLGVSERVLLQKVVAREVMVLDHDNQYHFPVFQFVNNGIIPGLSGILKSSKAPNEEVLSILLEKCLGDDSTYVDLLKSGITEVELNYLTETLEAYFQGDLAP
jgi:hypothetical protein